MDSNRPATKIAFVLGDPNERNRHCTQTFREHNARHTLRQPNRLRAVGQRQLDINTDIYKAT